MRLQQSQIDRATRKFLIAAIVVAVVLGLIYGWDIVTALAGVAFGARAVLIGKASAYLDTPHGPFTQLDGLLLLGFGYWVVSRLSRIVETLSDIRTLNRAYANALLEKLEARDASSFD